MIKFVQVLANHLVGGARRDDPLLVTARNKAGAPSYGSMTMPREATLDLAGQGAPELIQLQSGLWTRSYSVSGACGHWHTQMAAQLVSSSRHESGTTSSAQNAQSHEQLMLGTQHSPPYIEAICGQPRECWGIG